MLVDSEGWVSVTDRYFPVLILRLCVLDCHQGVAGYTQRLQCEPLVKQSNSKNKSQKTFLQGYNKPIPWHQGLWLLMNREA